MPQHHKWSEEETLHLINAIRIHGLDWRVIQYIHFPYLTPQNIKNKYYKKCKSDKMTSIKDFVAANAASKDNSILNEKLENDALSALLETEINKLYYAEAQDRQFAQSIDFSNRYYSLPWTRNQSLPMTAEMSLVDENEGNIGIDNKLLNGMLLHLYQQPSNTIFSPPMLSPRTEKNCEH